MGGNFAKMVLPPFSKKGPLSKDRIWSVGANSILLQQIPFQKGLNVQENR